MTPEIADVEISADGYKSSFVTGRRVSLRTFMKACARGRHTQSYNSDAVLRLLKDPTALDLNGGECDDKQKLLFSLPL